MPGAGDFDGAWEWERDDVIVRSQITHILIALCVGVMIGILIMALSRRTQPAPIIIMPPEPTPLPLPTATPGPIRVFVNGQVGAPAVYTLPADSLVQAAIEAAGGFLDEANTAVVNLAQPLSDGMQIYVPSLAEAVRPAAVLNEAAWPAGSVANDAGSGLVNINTADLALLETLPGIGPSTAQKIIEHRDAQGPFMDVSEIMNVSGIGQGRFEQIRDFITVEGD